ncbi:hypothetical protein BJV74DRAFT_244844 [Russula compacta]|nr:hypothetical protein BJV74DRAFT_244844 [Russula compacta]
MGLRLEASQGCPFYWIGARNRPNQLVWARGVLKDYIIRFTNNLNPNGNVGLGIPWPKWNPDKPKALIFQDSLLFPLVIGDDNYRAQPLDYVANLSIRYPI